MKAEEARSLIVQKLRERFGNGVGFVLDPIVASEPITTPVAALQEEFEPARGVRDVQILDGMRQDSEVMPPPPPTNLLLDPIMREPSPAAPPQMQQPTGPAPRPDLARHLLID